MFSGVSGLGLLILLENSYFEDSLSNNVLCIHSSFSHDHVYN